MDRKSHWTMLCQNVMNTWRSLETHGTGEMHPRLSTSGTVQVPSGRDDFSTCPKPRRGPLHDLSTRRSPLSVWEGKEKKQKEARVLPFHDPPRRHRPTTLPWLLTSPWRLKGPDETMPSNVKVADPSPLESQSPRDGTHRCPSRTTSAVDAPLLPSSPPFSRPSNHANQGPPGKRPSCAVVAGLSNRYGMWHARRWAQQATISPCG